MRLSLLLSLFASGVLSAASLKVSVDFSSGFDRGDWDEFYDVPGFPQVPLKTVKVLLPYEADLDSVTFRTEVAAARKERMSWEISSQPKPLCHDAKWVPESVSYDEGVHFPADHLGVPSVVIKHGYRVAYIPVFPVLYHAEKREGFKVRSGELTLKLKKVGGADTYRASMQDEKEAIALCDD